MKIPTRITGAYRGGELVEVPVRDRIGNVITPTGTEELD
jgi:hypothetical protein